MIEKLIAEAGSLKLKVNNLFERPLGGVWQANLRDDNDIKFFGWGVGNSAAEALAAAIASAKGELKEAPRMAQAEVDPFA